MKSLLILATIFLFLPGTASADVGTLLMIMGSLHLVFGNLLLGIIEGNLIAYIFKTKYLRSVVLLVVANYFSMIFGGLLMALLQLPMPDIQNVHFLFWVAFFISYLLTLLLEWPFVFFSFEKSPERLVKSSKASLCVQTITYGLLIAYYLPVSSVNLITEFSAVSLSSLSPSENIRIYYISNKDGNVYSVKLNGESKQKVFDLHSSNPGDHLYVILNSKEENTSSIVVPITSSDFRKANLIEIRKIGANLATIDEKQDVENLHSRKHAMLDYGPIKKLPSVSESPWELETGFWPATGLDGINRQNKKEIHFRFETPLFSLYIRNGVMITGERVIFQFGNDQICLLDLNSKQAAKVINGRGFVVTTEESG